MKRWGKKERRNDAVLIAKRYADFKFMDSETKWGIVESFLIRAQRFAPLSPIQIHNLLSRGCGRVLRKMGLIEA